MTNQAAFRENALFRGGSDFQMNACVGDNGGPYDLYDYAQGFLEASRLVIEQAPHPRAIVDTLVYPACFNFRHGIELFLKYAIDLLANLQGSGIRYRQNHSLLANWMVFKQTVEASSLSISAEDLAAAEAIVTCFNEVDPNGQIFRYPESIKGDQHLKEWALINLTHVGRALERTTAIFKEWHFELEGALDDVREREQA